MMLLILDLNAINDALAGKIGQPVVVLWWTTVQYMRTITGEGQYDKWAGAKCYGILAGEQLTNVDGKWAVPTSKYQNSDPRMGRLSGFVMQSFLPPLYSTFTVEDVAGFEGYAEQNDGRPRYAQIIAGNDDVMAWIRKEPDVGWKRITGSQEEAEAEARKIFNKVVEMCGGLVLT